MWAVSKASVTEPIVAPTLVECPVQTHQALLITRAR